MRSLIRFSTLLSLAFLFAHCKKEAAQPDFSAAPALQATEYEGLDQIKVAISQAVAEIAAHNPNGAQELIQLLSEAPQKRLLAADFSRVQISGRSLREQILEKVEAENPSLAEAVAQLCETHPHLALSLPPWYDAIPEPYQSKVEYAICPALRESYTSWVGIHWPTRRTIRLPREEPYEIVPIRVAEAEDVLLLDPNGLSLNGDLVLATHFPHTDFCPEAASRLQDFLLPTDCSPVYDLLDVLAFRDYLREHCLFSFANAELCANGLDDDYDGLTDAEDPDCQKVMPERCGNGIDDDGDGFIDDNDPDCVMGGEICTNGTDDDGDGLVDGLDPDCQPGKEVCNNFTDDDGDGLTDSEDPDCACEAFCERDCQDETNIMAGMQVSGYQAYKGLSNLPGGEAILSLHYNIVATPICGDPRQSGSCPPLVWKKVIWGSFGEFFALEAKMGPSSAEDASKVLFRHPAFCVKAEARYFDIPRTGSPQGIYAQLPYLQPSALSHWDGEAYGNVITMSLFEHDEVSISQPVQEEIHVTNSTRVALGKQFPLLLRAGQSDFYTGPAVTKHASYTYTIEQGKDVFLGDCSAVYCDQNFENEVIEHGIYKSTGSITSRLAF